MCKMFVFVSLNVLVERHKKYVFGSHIFILAFLKYFFRSLSSSEIEMLRDEFQLEPQDSVKIVSHHEPIPEVITKPVTREHILQRSITHDGGKEVDSDSVPRNYVENILKEQSSYYDDARNMQTKETHKFTISRDITRTETQVVKLPKPPPSFIIPRSRSTSPAPRSQKKSSDTSVPVYKSISVDTTHPHRFSAPPEGVTSRSSSGGSSPIGYNQFISGISTSEQALPRAGVLQSGSLDRLSPQSARRKFFESQPSSAVTYMSWPERNRRLLVEDRSLSLSNSTDIHDSDRDNSLERKYGLRTSLSMDDSTMQAIHRPVGGGHERSRSAPSDERQKIMTKSQSVDVDERKQSGIKGMFNAMKRKLKPKLRRSHSAHVPNKEPVIPETGVAVPSVSVTSLDDTGDRHLVRDMMRPIPIPDDKGDNKDSKRESSKEDLSRVSRFLSLFCNGLDKQKFSA